MPQKTGARHLIVQAATQCVADGEWDSTSMAAMRERAGVSNGSLFHHFRTRGDLTAAVVGAALDDHQRGLLAALSADAERGVTGVVHQHLTWVDQNPHVARFLLGAAPDVLRQAVSTLVLDDNRRFFVAVAAWLREQGWCGNPELGVVLALWVGPAQEFSRQRLAADGAASDRQPATALAAGAWSALHPLLSAPTAAGTST